MILQQPGDTGTHDETTLLEYNLQNQTEEVSSSEDSTTLTPTDYSSSRKEEDDDGDCDDSDSSNDDDDDDDDDNSSIDSDDNDDDSSDEFESEDEEFEPGYSVKESSDNYIDFDLEDGRCIDGEAVTMTKSSYVDPFAAPTTAVEGDEAAAVLDEVATEPQMVFLESKQHHQHEGKTDETKNRSTHRDIVMWPIPEASELRYINDEDLDRIIAITSAERRRRRKSRTKKRKKKKPLTFRRAIRKLKRGFRKNWTHRNTASAVMGLLTMGLGSFILWIFISMIGK